MFNEFISKLTPSDIIQILGIITSSLTAIVAIIISLVTLRQNSKMLEDSSRAIISIYPQFINAGTTMLFMVIKNFGNSPAIIQKFDYDFDFTDCYKFRSDRDYLKDFIGCSLAPGQSRICSLDYEKLTRPVTFSLEYQSGPKIYHESLTVDLQAGVNIPAPKVATPGMELKSISYTLQEMLQKNL
ncbi:hypothetical protein [Blautia ammoniilytica]|uniref:DUF4352 domain-containing protein n=1 Tax=Blautia ammoniilytica TaxID=2981782 RepID=A0ABT2TZM3_9FIRM|nr:hypothetical protein [Blautia ammoniilytica]MCU6767261.1 hypothetical protein [Blautia ammoniilytica]SCJ13180.1 Uncharacterised protein [uncultured Blautia sp.]